MENLSLPMILALALAPVAFIFTIVFVQDKYDREPLGLLILTFVLGGLTVIPVIYVELWLTDVFQIFSTVELGDALKDAFLVVAFPEETFKFIIIILLAYRLKHFDEPYDGIMYAVSVSLGFAAVENVMYVSSMGFEVAILRMFTAVPAHAAMGVLGGYFVGLAKFKATRKHAGLYLLLGFLAAWTVHGLYDFFLMYDRQVLALFAFIVLLISIILSVMAIRIHKRNSHIRLNKKP